MQKYFDDTVKTIREMIRFDSSLKESEENAPFGRETALCLQRFLEIAEEMGFETHNYDNYVGEVIFGEGKEFAILAHLDVVPAGSGWTHDPFGAEISDGKIWGRGTLDDKGPAVSCLYCLKALKDEGFKPNRKIKLILGCNEECGWECIKHYNEVAVMPEEGFSPDANFPVIYAEKGIAHIKSSFEIAPTLFTELTAGERANMVCDTLTATLTEEGVKLFKASTPKVENTRFILEGNVLTVKGKSAHGSIPHAGANALESAIRTFAEADSQFEKIKSFLFDDDAKLKEMNDVTGHLSMSPDVAVYKDGVLYITTDFRFPSTHKIEEITGEYEKRNIAYETVSSQAPLFNDPNGEMIQTLLKVYNGFTGKNEKPVAIGGGTYARALKCGCGFGPEEEGDECPIHQADEFITFDKIKYMNEIYYEAIKSICK